eukprot:350521-Chlamydomonas_euryale.AAC.6
MVARRHQHRGVLPGAASRRPHVVQRAVREDVLKLVGEVGISKVGAPCVANCELVEAEHRGAAGSVLESLAAAAEAVVSDVATAPLCCGARGGGGADSSGVAVLGVGSGRGSVRRWQRCGSVGCWQRCGSVGCWQRSWQCWVLASATVGQAAG